jgi:hypothetical protein
MPHSVAEDATVTTVSKPWDPRVGKKDLARVKVYDSTLCGELGTVTPPPRKAGSTASAESGFSPFAVSTCQKIQYRSTVRNRKNMPSVMGLGGLLHLLCPDAQSARSLRRAKKQAEKREKEHAEACTALFVTGACNRLVAWLIGGGLDRQELKMRRFQQRLVRLKTIQEENERRIQEKLENSAKRRDEDFQTKLKDVVVSQEGDTPA